MKRVLSVFCLICILFSFTACSASKTSSDGKTAFNDLQDDDLDLMGYTILLGMGQGEDDIFWYAPNTLSYDAADKRMKDLKDKYNCNFETEVSPIDQNVLISNMVKAIATGKKTYDMVGVTEMDTIIDFSSKGYLLPLDDFDVLDIHNTSLYGPANITETAVFQGRPYMLTDYTHPFRQLVAQRFLTFNTDLLALYGDIDLRSVYENKQWTWSTFEKYVSEYTVREENKTKTFALGGNLHIFVGLAIQSNGFEMAVKSEDGTYSSGLQSPQCIDAVNWVQKLRSDYKDSFIFDKYLPACGLNGDCFMYCTQLSDILGSVQYHVENYGIIPFPCGPSGTYGKMAEDPETYGIGIGAYSDEADAIAAVLRAFCEPFEEVPTLEDALALYDNMFFDSRDIQILVELTKYSRAFWWGGRGLAYLQNEVADSKNAGKSAVELIAKVERKTQEAIETYIVPNAAYVEEYFNK